jgi:hypothetical protein
MVWVSSRLDASIIRIRDSGSVTQNPNIIQEGRSLIINLTQNRYIWVGCHTSFEIGMKEMEPEEDLDGVFNMLCDELASCQRDARI